VNREFITVSGSTAVQRMLATELWSHEERACARLGDKTPRA
jgi:hypothetical protein